MLNEFIDFLRHSKKYGLKIMIRDLININKLYLQSSYIKTILDFARENKLKFTFFITAKNIKKRRKLVEQVIKEGHEIGSHGYNHILLGNKNYNEIYKELGMIYEKFSDIFGFAIIFEARKLSQYDTEKWKELTEEDAMISRDFAKKFVSFVEGECK